MTTSDKNNILRDKPSSEDGFEYKTHERIAEKINKFIKNFDGEVVGLEGDWGAGKSTIIEILKKKDDQIFIFTFDAWSCSDDEVKYQFLYELIKKYKETLKEEEEENIDKYMDMVAKTEKTKINNNKDILGLGTKLYLIFVSLIPIGVAFLNKSSYSYNYDGHIIYDISKVDLPLTIFLLIISLPVSIFFLSILIILIFIILRFFFGKDRLQYIFYFITKYNFFKSLADIINSINIFNFEQKRKETIIEKRENVFLDFSDILNKIVEEINKIKPNILIVLDNIDRVDKDVGVKVWNMVQLLKETKVEKVNYIIPYERESFLNIFNLEGSVDKISYLDKCFEIIFYVPKLSKSNFNNFLRKKIKRQFENSDAEIIHSTIIFLNRFKELTTTPRKVKKIINMITIHKDEKINLDIIVVYSFLILNFGLNKTFEAIQQEYGYRLFNKDSGYKDSDAFRVLNFYFKRHEIKSINSLAGVIIGGSDIDGQQVVLNELIYKNILDINSANFIDNFPKLVDNYKIYNDFLVNLLVNEEYDFNKKLMIFLSIIDNNSFKNISTDFNDDLIESYEDADSETFNIIKESMKIKDINREDVRNLVNIFLPIIINSRIYNRKEEISFLDIKNVICFFDINVDDIFDGENIEFFYDLITIIFLEEKNALPFFFSKKILDNVFLFSNSNSSYIRRYDFIIEIINNYSDKYYLLDKYNIDFSENKYEYDYFSIYLLLFNNSLDVDLIDSSIFYINVVTELDSFINLFENNVSISSTDKLVIEKTFIYTLIAIEFKNTLIDKTIIDFWINADKNKDAKDTLTNIFENKYIHYGLKGFFWENSEVSISKIIEKLKEIRGSN